MKLTKKKKGFTIVELVIVIGVIGILAGILIPTFVNVNQKAEEAALKSNLANSYSAYIADAADGLIENGTVEGAVTDTKYYTVALGQKDVVLVEASGTSPKAYQFVNDAWNTTPITFDVAEHHDIVLNAAATAYKFEEIPATYFLNKSLTYGAFKVYALAQHLH